MRIGLLGREDDPLTRALRSKLGEAGADVELVAPAAVPGAGRLDVLVDRSGGPSAALRSRLLQAAAQGTRVLNDPVRMAVADRHLDLALLAELGIRVPRTALLPEPSEPADEARAAAEALHAELPQSAFGWPAVLRPLDPCIAGERLAGSLAEALAIRAESGGLALLLQERMPGARRARAIVVGGERVILVPRDPGSGAWLPDLIHFEPDAEDRIVQVALRGARALGYELCGVEIVLGDELAVVDVVPGGLIGGEPALLPFHLEKLASTLAQRCRELAALPSRPRPSATFAELARPAGPLVAYVAGLDVGRTDAAAEPSLPADGGSAESSSRRRSGGRKAGAAGPRGPKEPQGSKRRRS